MDHKLTALISKYVSVKNFDGNQDLREIGLDSLKMITLLLEIEESFEIMIPDELLTNDTFSTTNKIKEVIEQLQSKGLGTSYE